MWEGIPMVAHDSVMINKYEWYRFSQNKGGHAIDFMRKNSTAFFCGGSQRIIRRKKGAGDTEQKNGEEDAGRQKGLPHPLAWIGTCQKEMKAVRLQGIFHRAEKTIQTASKSNDCKRGYL